MNATPLIVRARSPWRWVDLADLWQYRELLWFMALRDVKVRYKQAALGFAWALLQPVATMIVFALFFGKLGGVEDSVEHYPVFLYAGLLPWTFFAASVSASSTSLVNNAGMVQKIYFPRLILPLAAVGAPLVDYAAAMSVLVALMVWYGVGFSAQLLLLPLLVVGVMICALAVGVLVSALAVAYRDFRYVVPFVIQLGMLATPAIYYDVSKLPAKYEPYAWLIDLNPMNAVVAAFRGAVLNQPIDFAAWATSLGAMLLVLAFGLYHFKQTERSFADVI